MTYHNAQQALNDLKKTPRRLADIAAGRRAKIAQIQADDRLSTKAKYDDIKDVNATASGSVEQAAAVAQAAQDYIDQTVTSSSDGNTSEHARLLSELEVQRAWGRAERLLAAGKDPLILIHTAKDDPVMLRALRSELPSYVEAADPRMTYQELRRYLDAVNTQLDRAEAPHLTDLARLRRDLAKETEAGMYRLDVAAGLVRSEVTDGSEAPAIPGWDSDSMIPVS